jgi:hypothetical protein
MARVIRGRTPGRSMIGLTERHGIAVQRFWDKMIASGTPEIVAERRAASYARRLQNVRAINIARTETIRGSNEGLRQTWDQAQTAGLIGASAQREWIASTDACPICIGLDGNKVGIDEPFFSAVLGTEVMAPPAHPSCRCTQGMIP